MAEINEGREWYVDQIMFGPQRTEIVYHAAEDDVLVGGRPTLVSTVYQRLIMNELILDHIRDIQEAACDTLEHSLQIERATKRQRFAQEQGGGDDGGEDAS